MIIAIAFGKRPPLIGCTPTKKIVESKLILKNVTSSFFAEKQFTAFARLKEHYASQSQEENPRLYTK